MEWFSFRRKGVDAGSTGCIFDYPESPTKHSQIRLFGSPRFAEGGNLEAGPSSYSRRNCEVKKSITAGPVHFLLI